MEVISIESSKHKPGVVLDPHNDQVLFSGFSLPEDAMDFFLPLINWFYEYSTHCEEKIKENKILQLTFKLSYYNSASYRAFLEIFHILKKMKEKGMNIHLDWHYEKNDSSMFDGGKELAEMAELPVTLIEFT